MLMQRKPLLSDKLEHALRQWIKRAKPGDLLASERELARQYKVSRVTVRDATSRLENEGLLTRQIGRGTFVTGKNPGAVAVRMLCCDFPPVSMEPVTTAVNHGQVTEMLRCEHVPDFFHGPPGKSTPDLLSSEALIRQADIVSVNEGNLATLAQRGMLQPLDDRINASALVVGDGFLPRVVNALQYRGQQYGIPVCWSAPVLIYNRKLLRDSGVDFPDRSWTWPDVREACARIATRYDGVRRVKPLALELINTSVLKSVLWRHGARFFDDEGNCLADTRAFRRAVAAVAGLIREFEVLPYLQDDQFVASLLFERDRLAMAVTLHSFAETVTGGKPSGEWGMAPLPGGQGAAVNIPVQGLALVNPERSDEAFAVIEQVCAPDIVARVARACSRCPAVGNPRQDVPDCLLYAMEAPVGEPELPGQYADYRVLKAELLLVWRGLEEPDAACRNIKSLCQGQVAGIHARQPARSRQMEIQECEV